MRILVVRAEILKTMFAAAPVSLPQSSSPVAEHSLTRKVHVRSRRVLLNTLWLCISNMLMGPRCCWGRDHTLSSKVANCPTSSDFSKDSIIFLKIIYLFIHKRHRDRGRDIGRGRNRLHAGSPMWDSILVLQDHTLSQRQTLNR